MADDWRHCDSVKKWSREKDHQTFVAKFWQAASDLVTVTEEVRPIV